MIEVVVGDITRARVEAIVTAANESLMGGGGVDGAIHRAAGPQLARAGAEVGPCAPGEAVATPAFDLAPVRYVIHTVGPVWEGGGYGEESVLASCYRRSLEVADGLGVRSIAFPAIATGVYGYPPAEAARVAVDTLRSAMMTITARAAEAATTTATATAGATATTATTATTAVARATAAATAGAGATSVERIQLVAFDEETAAHLRRALG